jgi:primosomal replication protein N''
MIRFCPNCETERALAEFFCAGHVLDQPCGWDLSNEPIHPEGWRPQPVVALATLEPISPVSASSLCVNGHTMEAGDLMCLVCDGAPMGDVSEDAVDAMDEPDDVAMTAAPEASPVETVIDGWHVLRQINSTDGVRECYVARHEETDRQAVLTLYRAGAEPDPSIYDVLRRLPREHVPEIIATGRWNERAFEVSEELTGGTLSGLGIVVEDRKAVQHVVRELGQALHAFNEAGLRHRDLRPGSLLVRSREPLDLVISGFGSARLSEFDLDIVSPLETSRYMAPEAIAGGVAAASDWWSLGMILLEQLTRGACFEDIHPNAFLIHVLANGVSIPEYLDPQLNLLLRGLLARDRHQRWQWPEVQDWLDGKPVSAPSSAGDERDTTEGASIQLGAQRFHKPTVFALAAAQSEHWPQALDHLLRGVIVTWTEQIGLAPKLIAGLRQVAQHDSIEDDFRLMLALKLLNPEIPLIHRGAIVTPGWLLIHPLEGYRLIAGPVPGLLEHLQTETWLSRLRVRAENVRQRALHQHIELNEELLRIYLLSTSRAQLTAQWQERQRLLPDTDHPGLLALADRRVIAEEDLIVLLGAAIGQFRSADSIVEEAATLAQKVEVAFDVEVGRLLLQSPRQELYRSIDELASGFAQSSVPTIDEWAEQFRLERRMPLAKALVLLAVPREQWQQPQQQQYVSQILEFFEKKVASAVMRGPLVRMKIGKTTARADIAELGSERRPAAALLDHLLQRNARTISLDPESFMADPQLEQRLISLHRQSSLYKRDTGIDGLHLGFPFLLTRDSRLNTRTRIAPLLLWPVKLLLEVGSRGQASLAFDGEREEVRLNPALESLVGADTYRRWRGVADELLGRSALRAADVMDALGMLATTRSRTLQKLPADSVEVSPYQDELACSAVLFHVTFMGQAIGEDLRQLKTRPPGGTGLETALRLRGVEESQQRSDPPELDRYFTVASDPSQEAAVLQARHEPGLLVEGPPGTGKSQTIVNMIADAIGRQRNLLVICQKHAALEVVYKRLIAEGLGQRIVMLNDVNRDREPVIRNIREQLEALFNGEPEPYRRWQAQRERLSARIESLEGELDRFHQHLHYIDEASGSSYRQLLGELIELDEGTPALNFPSLRQKLASMDVASLTRLEENCAPLIPLWLPARYEGSPLAQLQPFAADAATLHVFTKNLDRLIAAESNRMLVLKAHSSSFEIDDPIPYRSWISDQVDVLMGMAEEQRGRLARWLPLFRGAAAGEPLEGDKLLNEFTDIQRSLGELSDLHAPLLSPALSELDDAQLQTLSTRADQVLEARSWMARLSPLFLLRRRKLRVFLAACGVTDRDAHLPLLLAAARLEAAWRPLRCRLGVLHTRLGLPPVGPECGLELATLITRGIQQLREIQILARSLAEAPRSAQIDTAMLSGEKHQLEALVSDVDAALIRHDARQTSFDHLKSLADWIGDSLLKQLHCAIAGNQSSFLELDRLHGAVPQLAAYQRFRGRAGQLGPEDLALFALLRQQQEQLDAVAPDQLEAAVRRLLNREARLGWKHRIEQAHPELQLGQEETRAKIAGLAEADTEMRALNRELLGKGIRFEHLGTRKQWDDVTRLTGKRSRRLREFIELGSALGLMSLRPIWLMNPDVASRVLPLKPGLFDTVIYDEASQIPVEFALPTLYRGRITVVSGDEKQMPPTAFFSSKIESDEAEVFDGETPDEDADEELRQAHEETWNRREIKDCPDLLQLARSALPTTTLQIHYRSAYRELISFSNASFYGNRLSVPVRHPQANIARIKPLELIQVNGLYQNQTNEREAERVVEMLSEIWLQPYAQRPSIGVVTFNRKQADLIEQHLELRAEQDATFRLAYTQELERSEDGEDMSVFVKNVENVQGDERDVIVFSSTFGRNSQGTFRRSFGVLGQTGGERRLNVAVTRARQKIMVITSMPIADVSDMLNTQRSPRSPRDYLQGYLEYARALSAGEFSSSDHLLNRLQTDRNVAQRRQRQRNDGFTAAVADYLNQLGWPAAQTTEDDAFGLDFAIERPDTGLYAIGIECDSPRHILLKKARAREIWRPSVLRRAIPHIHRVSSQGWYEDGDRERTLLQAAIENAMAPIIEKSTSRHITDTETYQ